MREGLRFLLAVLAVGATAPASSAVILDTFSAVSYSNNDGDQNWANDWVEVDAANSGGVATDPASGNVLINTNGKLSLDDRPNTGEDPSNSRQADLSAWSEAYLGFDWATTTGVDPDDSVVAEISSDGGATFTVLLTITGLTGSNSGQEQFNVTPYVSTNTTVRFRVNDLLGGSNEEFLLDYVYLSDDVDYRPELTIPEPTTFALMGLGLAGIGWSRRKLTA